MSDETVEKGVARLFADMLDYPAAGLAERVRESEVLVSGLDAGAADLLGEFRAFVDRTPLGQMEEAYTGTFDLDAACHPYVGYQLFGESYKRSIFLLEIKERYRSQGFAASEKELPDRLSEVLRFLSVSSDAELNREIICEALLPILEKMTKQMNEATHQPRESLRPYLSVLQALRLTLQRLYALAAEPQHASSVGGDP